jgi:hypothetical protein
MSERPSSFPDFAMIDLDSNAVEPDMDHKAYGISREEYASRQHINWQFRRNSEWLHYLGGAIGKLSMPLLGSSTNQTVDVFYCIVGHVVTLHVSEFTIAANSRTSDDIKLEIDPPNELAPFIPNYPSPPGYDYKRIFASTLVVGVNTVHATLEVQPSFVSYLIRFRRAGTGGINWLFPKEEGHTITACSGSYFVPPVELV